MRHDPSSGEANLAKLAATRKTVVRSRFARAMSTPWRLAMWLVGIVTLGAFVAALYLMLVPGFHALTTIALCGASLVGFTVLGMIAILYPGQPDELNEAVDGSARELEQQVAGMKMRLDLATSKGNRGRGPYGAGGSTLEASEVAATQEEVDASLEEIARVRRSDHAG